MNPTEQRSLTVLRTRSAEQKVANATSARQGAAGIAQDEARQADYEARRNRSQSAPPSLGRRSRRSRRSRKSRRSRSRTRGRR